MALCSAWTHRGFVAIRDSPSTPFFIGPMHYFAVTFKSHRCLCFFSSIFGRFNGKRKAVYIGLLHRFVMPFIVFLFLFLAEFVEFFFTANTNW